MTIIKTGVALAAALIFLITHAANAQQITDTDLKQNVQPLNNTLSAINLLQPLSFEYNNDKYKKLDLPKGRHYGFMADDVQQFLPGVIVEENKRVPAGKNNHRTVTISHVDYDKLIPLLVGAIKEQQAQIDELKASLHQLRSK